MHKFIHRMRERPEAVRRRIALGTSIGVVAIVGIVWGTSLVSSGSLALSTGSGSDGSDGAPKSETSDMKSSFSQLLGAVGAVTGASTTPPALTIIDGDSSSSFDSSSTAQAQNTATVIPF